MGWGQVETGVSSCTGVIGLWSSSRLPLPCCLQSRAQHRCTSAGPAPASCSITHHPHYPTHLCAVAEANHALLLNQLRPDALGLLTAVVVLCTAGRFDWVGWVGRGARHGGMWSVGQQRGAERQRARLHEPPAHSKPTQTTQPATHTHALHPRLPTHQVLLQREERVGVAEVVDVAGLGNLHEVLARAPCDRDEWVGLGGGRGIGAAAMWREQPACLPSSAPDPSNPTACTRKSHQPRWPLPAPARPGPPQAQRTLAVAGGAPGGDVALLHQVNHDVVHCRPDRVGG